MCNKTMVFCTLLSISVTTIKLMCTHMNLIYNIYYVAEFYKIIFLFMHLLYLMDIMLTFIIDSVELPGMRNKRKLQNENFCNGIRTLA